MPSQSKTQRPLVFPLPRLDDCFDALGESGAKVFSLIDLASGFLQLPMDENSKEKTAFITHDGLFQIETSTLWITQCWDFISEGYDSVTTRTDLENSYLLRG